jgi:2-polyprenyl-3-methyl-5-hydroxy-6-metoxy-1,4-benzoquinol methylase
MFSVEEIKIANATSRSNGASAKNKDGSIRAVVPKYISEHINKEYSILDFGAGKDAIHTQWLRKEGFNVAAYDFGENCIEGVHNKDALQKQYKVIMCSNVLNVQSSLAMLLETLKQINNSLEPGGEFVCNYPVSPRKMNLTANDLKEVLQSIFKGEVEKVGGSSSAPLWKVQKSYIN